MFRVTTLLFPFFAACQSGATSGEAATSESALHVATTGSAPLATASNTAEPALSAAAQATKWSGSYSVAVHRIDRPSQQVAWLRDDGRAHSGEGALSIERTTRDEVMGTARGPLGEQRVVGAFEGTRLTLSFTPVTLPASSAPPAVLSDKAENASFRGTAQCEASSGEGWSCTLSAVSSNGNLVRAGRVELRLGAPGAAP